MTKVLGCNLEMVDKEVDSGQRSMSESETKIKLVA